MKISSTILAIVLSSILPESHAFQSAAPIAARTRRQDIHIFSTPSAEDIKRIMQEESTNPASKYVLNWTICYVLPLLWSLTCMDIYFMYLLLTNYNYLNTYITIALADSAAAMKNMTPEDMGKLISEMESMPEAQKAQLKDMGMDPDTSK